MPKKLGGVKTPPQKARPVSPGDAKHYAAYYLAQVRCVFEHDLDRKGLREPCRVCMSWAHDAIRYQLKQVLSPGALRFL